MIADNIVYTLMNMVSEYLRRIAAVLVLAAGVVGVVGAMTNTVYAETSSSANYRVNEVQFGIGSGTNICSGAYCSTMSVGDMTVGRTRSDGYGAWAGFNTTTEPYLEVTATGGNHDLGTLDIDRTAVATTQVSVRAFMASGYVMQITGESPSQGSHRLVNLTTPSTSHQGAEQFGVNLRDNSAPDVGANTEQIPSSEFSFGKPADDYDTPDLFKYINGDIVAGSDRSSGETVYTISMIINVSNVTPGGKYTGAYSAVVVPMY